jgi:hypothetical protein
LKLQLTDVGSMNKDELRAKYSEPISREFHDLFFRR